MTTIAFDGKVLAADTCITIGGVRTRYNYKLRRFENGSVAGFAGDVEPSLLALDWLDSGGEPPGLKGGGEIVVVTPAGKIVLYNSKRLTAVAVSESIFAMGSGGDIALGAMMHGATAIQAVRYAIERDPDSGFDVVWLSI